MWLFTKYGFFSAVEVTGQPESIQVRARLHEDIASLAGLCREMVGVDPQIIETHDSDYRFRIVLPRPTWNEIGKLLATDIDYSNFKGRVLGPKVPKDVVRAYHAVWQAMWDLQRGRK